MQMKKKNPVIFKFKIEIEIPLDEITIKDGIDKEVLSALQPAYKEMVKIISKERQRRFPGLRGDCATSAEVISTRSAQPCPDAQ